MDETKSKKLALGLLKAVATEDVNRILASEDAFSKDENWRPYGGQRKNWDRIGNQQSQAVGALAELLINSIDAILMRKAIENNKAPESMTQAVKEFFPQVVEGKLASLKDSREMTDLAEKSVLVGVKRKRKNSIYPTYTIADFGEGQNPSAFDRTLLSLGENNKEGLQFVQGRFNMGSTGSIAFCTQANIHEGRYKLIISKRTTPDSDNYWGWTLIRVSEVKSGEVLPVVEYFCPSGEISKFKQESIEAFNRGDIGVIPGGTIIKLYEYDIGPNARDVDFGLRYALTTNLLECALPIRTYDFDAKPRTGRGKLRQEGIADSNFSGMRITVTEDDIGFPKQLILESSEKPSLGKIRIFATGVSRLPDYIAKSPYRIFYTINGQAQAKERASFLRGAKLDDLRQHLIVQVDCNEMDKTARSAIFMPDRERMSQNASSRALKELVTQALQNDGRLGDFARKVRMQRAKETIQDTEKGNKVWKSLLRYDPGLRDLFPIGDSITTPAIKSGSEPFNGTKFPTKLILLNPKDGVLHLPINTYRIIRCETDVENTYLSREFEQGKFLWDSAHERYSQSLRNGKLEIRVYPPADASVGDEFKTSFGFDDPSRVNRLTLEVTIRITEAAELATNEPGTTRDTSTRETATQKPPPIHWATQEDWYRYELDENSGACVKINEEGVAIYVNRDNKHLHNLLASEREESERELTQNMFKWAVGILTFSIYKRFESNFNADDDDGNEWDEHLKHASSAISAHVVTLIRRLSGEK